MTPQRASRRIHPELPIFVLELAETSIVYSPGNLCRVSSANAAVLEHVVRGEVVEASGWMRRLADDFLVHAREAEHSWQTLRSADMRPTCLTVYLSNACNLGCFYCFATTPEGARIQPNLGVPGLPTLVSPARPPQLDLKSLLPIARFVAESCRAQNQQFQLVIHGGGEPTLHWELLQRVVERTREIAAEHGIGWTSYLATHGLLPRERVLWLGQNFQRIGISCDGPPDLHDAHRPRLSGGGTFQQLAESLEILRDTPAELMLRATISRLSLRRQAEIVAFFVHSLQVRDLRFEALYRGHPADPRTLTPDDAYTFADHFVAAQRVAEVLDARLQMSGVRLDEIHGPYCNVLRDVIQVTPDGTASACFLSTDGRTEVGAEMVIGALDPATGKFELDVERIRSMRRQATEIPFRCNTCVNIYHCARDCPDVCPVGTAAAQEFSQPGFRCLVQKEVGERWIVGAATELDETSWLAPPQEITAQAVQIGRILAKLPARVEAEPIVRQWERAARFKPFHDRSQPVPPWSRDGFTDIGDAAWERLAGQLAQPTAAGPISCYVHLPYCDRKCGFCDCYSVIALPNEEERQQRYVHALLEELQAWRQFESVCHRPLTTVHLGGGTPTHVPPRLFEMLIESMRNSLHHSPRTEWALESTSSQLDREILVRLHRLGFTRLHLGVQSLDDRIRRRIGRQEPSAQVRRKLALALELGFIVSVDLIYGLPDQTVEMFVDDLEAMIELNLDGCSLYHLNESARNRAFLMSDGGPRNGPFDNYLAFQIGEQMLKSSGYTKNHFAHFSRPRDQNLYYRHLLRGEDLLALGASADGCFGAYSYRHPPLGDYLARVDGRRVPLEGGLFEAGAASTLGSLSAAVMAGTIEAKAFAECHADTLRVDWLRRGLVERNPGDDHYVLTANGSWYLSHLLADIERHDASTTAAYVPSNGPTSSCTTTGVSPQSPLDDPLGPNAM